jgi:copper resistance protein C
MVEWRSGRRWRRVRQEVPSVPSSDLPVRAARAAAAALLAVAAIILPAAPALAHNQLASSQPGQNTRVAESPEEIVLEFTERLNADYTTIVITDSAGAQMPVDGPEVDQQRGTVRPVQPLPDGVYTVAYRVVSADGHPVQGAYRFAVNAPLTDAGAPPPAASAPAGEPTSDPAAAGEPADDNPGSSWALYSSIAAFVVLAVIAVRVAMFRRQRVT